MDTKILQFIPSKTPKSTIPILTKPSRTQTRICLPRRQQSLKLNANNNSNDLPPPPPAPQITPPETVEIRFRRGSRKRTRQREEKTMKAQATSDPAPKKWEDMSLTEKAIELYVGEKGLLFWLNKFAYASIFIVIGAWILFRFVGPSLNLYQLDSTPLPPSSMFKG